MVCRVVTAKGYPGLDYMRNKVLPPYQNPGYEKLKIDPNMPDGMDYIHYTMEILRGIIGVKCYRKDDQIVKGISVPETAEVVV